MVKKNTIKWLKQGQRSKCEKINEKLKAKNYKIAMELYYYNII